MIKTSCKSGCHWCCYIPVWCREAEARAAWEACDQKKVRQAISSPDAGKDFDPCVFLNKRTRRCSIYDNRPATCRGYNSTSRTACKSAHKWRMPDAPIPVEMTQFLHWKEVREGLPGPDRLLVDWLREFSNGS